MATESHLAHVPATDSDVVMASFADPEAFAEIFDRHFTAIHKYVARRVGSDLADDLAAEAFTIAFQRRRSFHPETDSARPWLFGIATNLIRTSRRSEQRLLAAVARLSHQATSSMTDDMDKAQAGVEAALDMPRVARALGELKPNQRDVLLLHYWAGLTHAEIALSLRISPGTVASRVARARTHVRTALADRTTSSRRRFARQFPEEER